MRQRQFLIGTVILCIIVTLSNVCEATTLLINQVSPYFGNGYGLVNWRDMTSELKTAFGVANITVSSSPLTNLESLLSYDRLWITLRQPNDVGLNAVEQANLAAYIAAGHRAVLIGENIDWTAWNNSILAPLGGTYSRVETAGTLTAVYSHQLTAGVSTLNTYADGVADVAAGGTPLFSANVATLWGSNKNVLSLLSANVMDDLLGGRNPDNLRFNANIAQWLAAPEPASVIYFVVGIASLLACCRRCRVWRVPAGKSR